MRDAAGNEQLVHGERAIEVANDPAPDSASGVLYTIAASFRGSSRSKLTVPYGRRVTVRGRLTRGSQPVAAGTRIEVLERLDRRGARERSTRSALTKSDGSFSIGLATSRPSRVVRLAYRPVGGATVVSRALRLRVTAALRVRASLRGRAVSFSGRVLSGPMPKGGKRVQMEGRSPGSAWTPFKTLRTDKRGRFSGRYRLRVRRPGVVLENQGRRAERARLWLSRLPQPRGDTARSLISMAPLNARPCAVRSHSSTGRSPRGRGAWLG